MATFFPDGTHDSRPASTETVYRATPLRLAVALGDPDRERALLPHLTQSEDITVVVRCLAAEELLAAGQDSQVDLAVAASDLHRLTPAILRDLSRMSLHLVLLALDPENPRWEGLADAVIPEDVEPEVLIDAILATARGERPRTQTASASRTAHESEPTTEAHSQAALSSLVLAVTSGAGSPGRTTIAINLAAGLGAVAPTVLVDADLVGPSVAVYLDADPTRNLAMLAHTDPDSPSTWERAIGDEIQPIGLRSPHGRVLCGVPKPEMQSLLSRRFLDLLIGELTQRYRYVLLDVGAEGLRGQTPLQRLALATAHHTLFVTSADLVGLFRARTALGRLQTDDWQSRVALVINQYDASAHHRRGEIEWALGMPLAAIIPYDRNAAQHALVVQRPLVLESRGRTARALLELAGRVHGGSILLPPEEVSGSSRRRWGRLHLPLPWRLRIRPVAKSHTRSSRWIAPS